MLGSGVLSFTLLGINKINTSTIVTCIVKLCQNVFLYLTLSIYSVMNVVYLGLTNTLWSFLHRHTLAWYYSDIDGFGQIIYI